MLQGYDSVAVEADVEFGGTDQKFNLMVGRELQQHWGQKPQIVYTVPLLVGTDGGVKMSKSLGNYIAVEDPPGEMYGKVMSIPDHAVGDYMDWVTDIPDDEVEAARRSIEARTVNPRDVKMRLARGIVTQFHGEDEAAEAEDAFVRTFSKRELPEDVPSHSISFRSAPGAVDGSEGVRLPWLLTELGLTTSASEANRLIRQRAVEIDGEVVEEATVSLRDGMIIRVGKHRFLRVSDSGA
jgi:tyrosyl-tRNA synthetase